MNEYRVAIWKRPEHSDLDWELVVDGKGTSYELVKFLQGQIKILKKEPYLVPRFEGELPLEGLEGEVRQ